MRKNHTARAIKRARSLCKDLSVPEAVLWSNLRNQRIGFKFRRQCPRAGYVLDFFCQEAMLNVELDGITHEWSAEADARRDATLATLGIKVVRIPAGEVSRDAAAVAEAIRVECCLRCGQEPW